MSAISINKEMSMKQASDASLTSSPKVASVAPPLSATESPASKPQSKRGFAWSAMTKTFFQWLLPPVIGLGLLVAIWAVVATQSPGLPGPIKTWFSAPSSRYARWPTLPGTTVQMSILHRPRENQLVGWCCCKRHLRAPP